MKKDNNQKKIFRIKDIISLILFTLSLLLSIYTLNLLFSSPLGEGRIVSYLILTLSLPVMIFLAIGLLRHFTNFIKKSWIYYTFQFLVTLMLPLVIMGNIEDKIQEKTLATVKHELTPMITYIENYKDQYGYVPENITKVPINPHILENISYAYNSNIFMLETHVPSIDIDGTRIFYNSKDKHWYQFHNDEYQYYQDKKEKPDSIGTYMSLLKQIKTRKTLIIKNGQWIDPRQDHTKAKAYYKKACELGLNDDQSNYIKSSK